ncbi:hypothetical protein [Vibrio sp. SCSIO 43155]|uniref:hypothetical protein n=1 Tax=Vibrio TaxID=662 RepID=UPI00207545C8|nr:hypothetical protein [Vibrio sp. SCSIO 43155]USD58654.1 hypothetical protein J4N44_27260 [Vibrio sp. SCSIO 43155]
MPLLKVFNPKTVLRHHYGNKENANISMLKSISLYWKYRSNEVARARIKSAIHVIRVLTSRPLKTTATIGVLMPSSSLPTGLYRVSMETVALSNDYRAGGDKKVPQKSRD